MLCSHERSLTALQHRVTGVSEPPPQDFFWSSSVTHRLLVVAICWVAFRKRFALACMTHGDMLMIGGCTDAIVTAAAGVTS